MHGCTFATFQSSHSGVQLITFIRSVGLGSGWLGRKGSPPRLFSKLFIPFSSLVMWFLIQNKGNYFTGYRRGNLVVTVFCFLDFGDPSYPATRDPPWLLNIVMRVRSYSEWHIFGVLAIIGFVYRAKQNSLSYIQRTLWETHESHYLEGSQQQIYFQHFLESILRYYCFYCLCLLHFASAIKLFHIITQE